MSLSIERSCNCRPSIKGCSRVSCLQVRFCRDRSRFPTRAGPSSMAPSCSPITGQALPLSSPYAIRPTLRWGVQSCPDRAAPGQLYAVLSCTSHPLRCWSRVRYARHTLGGHGAPKHDSGHLRNSKTAAIRSQKVSRFFTGCHPGLSRFGLPVVFLPFFFFFL